MSFHKTLVLLCTITSSGCYSTNGSTIQNGFLAPSGPPSQFSLGTFTPGNQQVQLYWNNSVGASSYQIYYGTSSGSYPTLYSSNATSPTSITGLTNGTPYYFMVIATAKDGFSKTPASAEVSATPGQPTLSALSNLFSLGISSSWSVTVPFTLGGGPFLSCTSNLSATSSNTAVIANNQINFGGTYPNCTATLQISAAVTGSTTVTFNATYGSATSSQSLNFYSTTPATGAYSLRKIVLSYSGSAVNVRRTSDNTTQDIGFTAAGDLDTASLLAFTGASSGYLTTWYDQSGNGNHLVQAAAANQFRIVNAGIVATSGVISRPAVSVPSTSCAMNYTGTVQNVQTISAVRDLISTNSFSYFFPCLLTQIFQSDFLRLTTALFLPLTLFPVT